jgi:polyisoprenoid-binding protein YceI
MKRLATAFALALVAVLATSPARAAVDTYTVDRSHSEAAFQIRHFVTQVRGQFDDFTGTIRMDPDNAAASSVEFEIAAASINTFNADRDKHLRSADFFDVEKHPRITFRSSRVEKTGEATYKVTGTLSLHGVSKEITLPVEFLGKLKTPFGDTRAGFAATATLDRKDFGISWNRAMDQGGAILGDEVRVLINLETVLQAPTAAGP